MSSDITARPPEPRAAITEAADSLRNSSDRRVKRLAEVPRGPLVALLADYRLKLHLVPTGTRIPGSYWGGCEAGLVGGRLYARDDTPVHSVLHEACHYICMPAARRAALDTDAGGGDAEENAVCYLQIVLADEVSGFGRERMLADMDAWGYSFRLGSARAWFEGDAEDAHASLRGWGLLAPDGTAQRTLRP